MKPYLEVPVFVRKKKEIFLSASLPLSVWWGIVNKVQTFTKGFKNVWFDGTTKNCYKIIYYVLFTFHMYLLALTISYTFVVM